LEHFSLAICDFQTIFSYVRNPVWIETTVWLFLLYICHTVIHRKLQNVVYMKKKIDVKKRWDGQSEVP
jgi:hypothetical protein